MNAPATVHSLTYYPVKGCAGITVDRAEVTARGLRHDREFMVVAAETGRFLSQRRLPSMAVVQPRMLDDGDTLALSAPGVEDLKAGVVEDGPRREVSVFSFTGQGVDQGDDAARWFGVVLGVDCRLVRVPPDHTRVSSGETGGTAGFADGHALLVASLASLAELNRRLAERDVAALPMNRFRPNVVLDGWTEPHAEDLVRSARLGEVEIGYEKRCKRCAVPTVDQETGRPAGPEPTRTLATYRGGAEEGGVVFGMKAAVVRPGVVSVGDTVTVHRWA
ncbi:MOSC domain-containing protein [Streptoalloteichus tenebrarius]|uniref:MOSC domain-containing protein n=1 Tax=Streptoalloteichus tenebrarius (strain ATCC 17920 / DSM 40477 / JCM 4838 / CBS 697.72 / NBRC 16177 / NCIMB 11028 / NRRL B-12390 / A12253. 1 / ISP 5477) TaxID=1933 RepID=UPI0020A2C306|nr:MOSC N-terminal beta barrel domain-containing protein [Streptoalloteichus tenebrarius]BFF02268.1 MOSC N-terminal beta barrel domain-containing protein [Streptoalloteichus tenebrarius]